MLNKAAACSHLEHNAGKVQRRRSRVYSPGVFPIKEVMLSIRYVLVSTVYCLSSVDNPSISLGDQVRVTGGRLEQKELLG